MPQQFPSSLHSLQDFVDTAVAFATVQGIGMRIDANPSQKDSIPEPFLSVQTTFQTIPFSLLPSPVPRYCFDQAVNLAPDWGLLVHQISKQPEFIISALSVIPESDTFTRRLMRIYSQLQLEPSPQKIEFGSFRSDYMFHQQDNGAPILQQVELNTIAAGLGSLSSKVSDLHRLLVRRGDVTPEIWQRTGLAQLTNSERPELSQMPHSESVYNLPAAMAKAHQLYNNPKSIGLMVVQKTERNICDQRSIELVLWEKHHISLIRRTLKEIGERARLDPQTQALEIDGHTIAFTYFRAGYSPDDYPTETEWNGRILIERSLTIKCPNIGYHLIGTKKIQQHLAVPGVLERFMDAEACSRIRACFTGLWPLGDEKEEAELKIIEKVTEAPHRFVLKPQREGGGHNFFGTAARDRLMTMSPTERGEYILMSKIEPKYFPAVLCRGLKVFQVPNASSELGIFTYFISEGDDIKLNTYGGYLLRTHIADQEAGLVGGSGTLDSPYLID